MNTKNQPLSAGELSMLIKDADSTSTSQQETTMKTLATEGAVAGADIEAVEALLGDLEIGSGESAPVIEHIELDAGAESAVEGAIAKAEVYEELPGGGTGGIAAPAETPATETKVKKAKTPKAAKVKAPRELSALAPETFALNASTVADDTNKANVIALRPAQKKIGEKFDNLFLSIANNKKPSIYTVACFNTLVEKKTVTSSDLVAALRAGVVSSGDTKGATYDEGTARSQAGQMMALFAVVGIASREKQTLTFIADSPVASKLSALIAA